MSYYPLVSRAKVMINCGDRKMLITADVDGRPKIVLVDETEKCVAKKFRSKKIYNVQEFDALWDYIDFLLNS